MAQLILSDGKQQTVTYNQAAEIYQVLKGDKKPKNKKQEEFCSRVQDVIFPEVKKTYMERPKGVKDEKLATILADKKLKGYAKYEAVRNHLQGRLAG